MGKGGEREREEKWVETTEEKRAAGASGSHRVVGGRELEALGSTGPLHSKTIESTASVTYPRARGRRVVAKVLWAIKKKVSLRLERKTERERGAKVLHFSGVQYSHESILSNRNDSLVTD